MNEIIQFPKTEKNEINPLFQGICPGMIPANNPEDEAVDEIFDEIETLFYGVETRQLSAAEASSILIGRLAGSLIHQEGEKVEHSR